MSIKWSPATPAPTPLTPLASGAKAQLARALPGEEATGSATALLHELQVHQIELEMENETLRQTQFALEKSRDRYVHLYEFAPVGYLTLSDAGLITEINLTGATMLGVERKKLLNHRPDALVVAADRERWQRQFTSVMAQEGRRSFDLTLKHPGGSLFDVHFDCLRMDNGDAKPTLRVTLTDISERKRAERMAEQERTRLQTILRMVNDGIHILDRDGVLIEANQAFLNMLGYDESVIGKLRVTDWDVPNSWANLKALIDDLITRHGKRVFATRHLRRDGVILDVEISASWIEIEGKSYLYAASRDITEQILFEHMLQEKNLELESAKLAAEKANQAKSEFLSSMSHELRTPLNAVLGFAQLMEAGTPPPSSAQIPKINQILKAGWHLLGLINEILDLAKIESGKTTLSQEPISISEVLTDCQAMIEPLAQQRGIQVSFPDLEHPYYVHGDRTGVKQVMLNLLSNAIKYNRVGGTIMVQCAMIGNNGLRVSVTDSGAGLAPEQLAQLFQPFNRLGRESGPEEGTGIGLIVTKHLVELMGGVVGVESSVGVGSVFWFELAASSAPKLAGGDIGEIGLHEQDQVAAQDLLPKRTLLYVEDNPSNLTLVEELIARRSDLKLLTAVDGHQGIHLARTVKPDVILMDLNLPDISGYDALTILRDDPATAHIPVMALTARATQRDMKRGMEAGFFRYLTKPIKVIEFMDALDMTLHYSQEIRSTH